MNYRDRITIAWRAITGGSIHPGDPLLAAWFGAGGTTAAGKNVTPENALAVVAVFTAVRLISETLGSLPLKLFRDLGNGKGREEARGNPLWKLLHDQPNEFQTSMEFLEMMQGHALLRGNAYAEIISTGGRAVDQLLPLHPDRVFPFKTPGKKIAYRYSPLDGPQRILLQDEMFHLRDMSFDGISGVSRIMIHKEAIGLAKAQEEFAGKLYSNAARPSGILKSSKKLGEDARKRLKEAWNSQQAGSANAGKTPLLEDGIEWQQIGMSAEDAQFLQSRKFTITEIARMFRVPPHMIGDLEKSSFNNIEQQSLDFVRYTMRPWFVRWEQRINMDLITEPGLSAQFMADGILRGDFLSRQKGYATGRQWGWLSVNDVRQKENMNPIEDGDGYMAPVNMTPLQVFEQMVEEAKEGNGDEAPN